MIHAPTTPDPFGRAVLENPQPFHEWLRETAPVVYLEQYGVYAMGRYADVHAALVDWQNFESSSGVGISNFRKEAPWRQPSVLLEADPPHHDAPRGVLAKILSARELGRLRAQWVADADELVDSLLSRGTEFDAVPELAEAFPLRVFPDAVGISGEGRENLLPYGDHLFNTFGPHNWLTAKGEPHIAESSRWVAEQCSHEALSSEGFGARIWAAADRGEITAAQAPLMVRSLLSAGVDTTVIGLSAILNAFATHPEQWQRLRHEPALARAAFDEAIRLESPVQTFFRTATRDIVLGETVIPEGEKILMFLASANRDPRRWTDPHSFDITRDPSGHVGFGMGIHQCVGQHVARLEASILLAALARRISAIEPAGSAVRHLNNTLRGFDSIPVSVTVA
ncbi:cytochrome P450 [Leifsonia kafniensis]|uniref:Cytochrome P450 n=1 Tax=Leifsonia kafniensis TaxID=475957 RepID=A0ABP7KXA1_9MICO